MNIFWDLRLPWFWDKDKANAWQAEAKRKRKKEPTSKLVETSHLFQWNMLLYVWYRISKAYFTSFGTLGGRKLSCFHGTFSVPFFGLILCSFYPHKFWSSPHKLELQDADWTKLGEYSDAWLVARLMVLPVAEVLELCGFMLIRIFWNPNTMQDLNVCDVNPLVIHVQVPRQIWHRNWSTDHFNDRDWLEKIFKYIYIIYMSIYATSFPGHASPHPTSFCSCSAGTTSDGGGMIWDDLGMTLLLMYIWWYHWMLGFDSDGLLDQLQVELAPTNSGVLIKWTAKHACLKHFAQKTNESKELFRWVSRLPWGTSVGASLAAAQTCLEYSRLQICPLYIFGNKATDGTWI